MEPSTAKFTAATSAPAVYNVACLSCANWHFSVHKSPKKSPSSPILWGLASSIQNDLNFLIREDILYSLLVICNLPDIGKGGLKVWETKLERNVFNVNFNTIHLLLVSWFRVQIESKQEMNINISSFGAMNKNHSSRTEENIRVNLLLH